MRILKSLALALLVSGCVNGFEKGYQPNPDLTYDNAAFASSSDEPRVIKGTTPKRDNNRLERQGYALIGSSEYATGNRTLTSDDNAIEFAEEVGADVVVVYKMWRNTTTGQVTRSTTRSHSSRSYGTTSSGGRNPGRSHVTLFGRNTGSGGRATSGRSTTTTSTPVSREIHVYTATFWRKLKQGGLGITFRELTPEEQRISGSNKGVAVIAISRKSVAFEADILVGDIVRKIGRKRVVDVESALPAMRASRGRTVEIVLWRNGKEIRKKVRIPKRKSEILRAADLTRSPGTRI